MKLIRIQDASTKVGNLIVVPNMYLLVTQKQNIISFQLKHLKYPSLAQLDTFLARLDPNVMREVIRYENFVVIIPV